MKLLLDNGAEVDQKIPGGGDFTALSTAIQHGFTSIAALLIKRGASPHGVSAMPGGEPIKDGYDAQPSDSNPLFLAAWKGQSGIVKLLLEHEIWVDRPRSDKPTALHIAAQEGHYQVVRMLLAAGANPHVLGPNLATPLHTAAENHHPHVLHLMLEKPAEETTQVMKDIQAKHYERKEAKLEELDQLGRTPLQIAAGKGFDQCVQVLLEYGANPLARTATNDDGPDAPGLNAVDFAAKHGHVEVMHRLLSAAPQGTLTARDRETAEGHAEGYSHQEEVRHVLDEFFTDAGEL